MAGPGPTETRHGVLQRFGSRFLGDRGAKSAQGPKESTPSQLTGLGIEVLKPIDYTGIRRSSDGSVGLSILTLETSGWWIATVKTSDEGKAWLNRDELGRAGFRAASLDEARLKTSAFIGEGARPVTVPTDSVIEGIDLANKDFKDRIIIQNHTVIPNR